MMAVVSPHSMVAIATSLYRFFFGSSCMCFDNFMMIRLHGEEHKPELNYYWRYVQPTTIFDW